MGIYTQACIWHNLHPGMHTQACSGAHDAMTHETELGQRPLDRVRTVIMALADWYDLHSPMMG